MTLSRPRSTPSRQQSLGGQTPRNGPGALLRLGIPTDWVHDRFARALIESYRVKNPQATKEQMMEAVLQTMSSPKSGTRVPPAAQLKPFLERVMMQRTAVSKKMADLAQKRMSAEKGKSATKVALEIFNQALKSKKEHDAKSGGTPRAPVEAAAAAKSAFSRRSGVQRPVSAPQQRGPARAAAAVPMAPTPRVRATQPSAGGGKAKGGKGPPHHAKETPQEAAKKAKEAKAELVRKAKEEKALKEAKQAMQKEVARLMKAPKLTFPERISLPDCDAALLKSGDGQNKKNKKGKLPKISLLSRLIDLLYYGGLRPDKRRPNPVHRSDIHGASPMQISAILNDNKATRINLVSNFLSDTYSRLVLIAQRINTQVDKIVIKTILETVASVDPTVSEVTQKFILSKVLGKYQRETLEMEKDPEMPKVSLENQIPGMDGASLIALDNGRLNEWLERNAYAFGFSEWLLAEFHNDPGSNSAHLKFVLDGADKHESIVRWIDGKDPNADIHAKAHKHMMMTHLMESEINTVQSMFGIVYNMLADVLVASHAPFHRVMLQNFINLYLRMWNSEFNNVDVKTNMRRDVNEFKANLRVLVSWPGERHPMPEQLVEKASAILKSIMAHRVGGCNIVEFITTKDLHDAKLAPEHASMYHAFLKAITEERIHGLQVREFGHMEQMLRRQAPMHEAAMKHVTGEYRQVTGRVFQELSNRFVQEKTREKYEDLKINSPVANIMEYKHGYDSIIHRLGTLVGWIKDVGPETAKEALSVQFLNEQGFVSWPLVDAQSTGNPDAAKFMQARNLRLADLMGLTKSETSSERSLFGINGRFNYLVFDSGLFNTHILERKEELDAKRQVVRPRVKRERSEAYLALLEARKAKRVANVAEKKNKKAGKKMEGVEEGKIKKKKNSKKKVILAEEKALIQEEKREEKARIEEILEEPVMPAVERPEPIKEEKEEEEVTLEPEGEEMIPARDEAVVDGKDEGALESPRDVTNVAF